MHDDAKVGSVLVGEVGGFTDMFRPDLPLLNWGTIAGVSAGNLPVSPFPVVAPGFSTRGLSDAFGSLRVVVGSGFGTSFMIDFSVRSDPGFHGVGAGIQIEIETLSGTTRLVLRPPVESSWRWLRTERCCAEEWKRANTRTRLLRARRPLPRRQDPRQRRQLQPARRERRRP